MGTILKLIKLIRLQRRAGGIKGTSKLLQDSPKYLRLFRRLFADSRVPAWNKAMVVAAAAFAISPLNIPGYIPVIGALDDLGLFLLFGGIFMKNIPAHVLAEHKIAVGLADSPFLA